MTHYSKSSPCSSLLLSMDCHVNPRKVPDKKMEIVRVFQNLKNSRVWTCVRRVMRGRRKLAAGLVRRVVWASVRLRRRADGRIGWWRRSNGHNLVVRYDMMSYSKNFDDGVWQQEDVEYYRSRSFAHRFGQSPLEISEFMIYQ